MTPAPSSRLGGIGFITGDGRPDYSPELASQVFYDARIAPGRSVALDYQPLANPTYETDRTGERLLAADLDRLPTPRIGDG